jgi:hypothetical protein
MITLVEKVKIAKELNDLENVATEATLVLKEFDDSSVDYSKEDAPEKPFSKTVFVKLKYPSKDSFVDYADISNEMVLDWVNSSEGIVRQIRSAWNNAFGRYSIDKEFSELREKKAKSKASEYFEINL